MSQMTLWVGDDFRRYVFNFLASDHKLLLLVCKDGGGIPSGTDCVKAMFPINIVGGRIHHRSMPTSKCLVMANGIKIYQWLFQTSKVVPVMLIKQIYD